MRHVALATLLVLGCGKKTEAPTQAAPKAVAVDAKLVPVADAPTVRPPQTFNDAERLPAHGVFGETMGLATAGPQVFWIAVDFDSNRIAFLDGKGNEQQLPLAAADATKLKALVASSQPGFSGPPRTGCTDYREILAVGDGPAVMSVDSSCPLDDDKALGPLREALWALRPK
ncbi:MAG TPA: hypothetical protein PLF40_19570 [Kofleriaceae bacterium]|nr:hypothetical protein [Kofleriaceae bacterium]